MTTPFFAIVFLFVSSTTVSYQSSIVVASSPAFISRIVAQLYLVRTLTLTLTLIEVEQNNASVYLVPPARYTMYG